MLDAKIQKILTTLRETSIFADKESLDANSLVELGNKMAETCEMSDEVTKIGKICLDT